MGRRLGHGRLLRADRQEGTCHGRRFCIGGVLEPLRRADDHRGQFASCAHVRMGRVVHHPGKARCSAMGVYIGQCRAHRQPHDRRRISLWRKLPPYRCGGRPARCRRRVPWAIAAPRPIIYCSPFVSSRPSTAQTMSKTGIHAAQGLIAPWATPRLRNALGFLFGVVGRLVAHGTYAWALLFLDVCAGIPVSAAVDAPLPTARGWHGRLSAFILVSADFCDWFDPRCGIKRLA